MSWPQLLKRLDWRRERSLTLVGYSRTTLVASWQGALRDGLEKYGKRDVSAYLHRPQFELYDLEQDPDEITNLAEMPEHAPLVDEFCQKLKAFQQETKDPWLHKWDYE